MKEVDRDTISNWRKDISKENVKNQSIEIRQVIGCSNEFPHKMLKAFVSVESALENGVISSDERNEYVDNILEGLNYWKWCAVENIPDWSEW